MFDGFKSLFFGESGAVHAVAADDVRLAAAALLVEAATVDGSLEGVEGALVLKLLGERFHMSDEAARALLAQASALQKQSNQLFPFTKVIVEKFDFPQRINVIEMLWEVVFANGQLHDYEASLVRRVAGLLFVSDQDSGAARQRAMARLGLAGPLV
ncbi:TerB family tellurite resistance protein [Telmatospirillum sp.]|uniref:tellurite resistance TerB family protein n=1 Tax=Telmatospirillum sp. TaxID=2079197 RepID=UPI00284A39F5|nr:TerB family tellurite resistance protein [Telmatospirillum sp.]MDR3436331.1 TerB family tellurite resistance protein [Telmatospirillum sp.]